MALMFAVPLFTGYQNAYANGVNKLVETEWLAKNLNTVKVIFVDNWPSDKEAYMKKHIKGSVYMGIGALMGAISPNPPDKEKFEGMMHRLGVNSSDHVVLYGAKGDSVFVLGAFWLMEYFGNNNVKYLNGGLAKWNKENLPSEGGMKQANPGNFKVSSRNESIRIVAEDVLKKLGSANTVIVDSRNTEFYTGKTKEGEVKRLGHIPGALDMGYYVTNFNEKDGTFKSTSELKSIYEAKGVTKDKEVITYCQGGIKAANSYFVLKHLLGYPDVKVYVGSWGEWSGLDPDKYPIEK